MIKFYKNFLFKMESKKSKTVRLVYPQWQGGVNPNYAIGSEILNLVLPKGKNTETLEVPVDKNFDKEIELKDGINEQANILKQLQCAFNMLETKNPDKVITLGGDCSVSQPAFDYLHGKYPEKTCIVWLDAHPDISTPKDFEHEHAMILGNLLGDGAPNCSKSVKNKFKYDEVMYGGLIHKKLLPYEEKYLKEKNLKYAVPEDLKDNSNKITNWIKENGFKQVLIHLDLDVLSPTQFRSLLCNEPNLPTPDYAIGEMNLKDIVRIIVDISKTAKLVGFSIAEYMPWDIINMRKEFSKIDIFQD
jgi:arginase